MPDFFVQVCRRCTLCCNTEFQPSQMRASKPEKLGHLLSCLLCALQVPKPCPSTQWCSALEDALKLLVWNSPAESRQGKDGNHWETSLLSAACQGEYGLSSSPAHQPSWKLLKKFWHNPSEAVLCPCVLTCLFAVVLNKCWQKILNVCQIWERGWESQESGLRPAA